MGLEKYDFSGWATRNNIKCSDGRTILRDAFKHNDGKTVPLVFNHQHNDVFNTIGHAMLENRDTGVYAYCAFNDTEAGKTAKMLVEHGDISALSIYANRLKQQGGHVVHGEIREVSLVHAGANPGAFIDSVMYHGEGEDDGESAVIYTGEAFALYHSEGGKGKEEDEKMSEGKEQPKKEEPDETVEDVFNTLSEKQKTVVYALVGQALAQTGDEDEEEGDKKQMKHNVFSSDHTQGRGAFLSHSEQQQIVAMAKSNSIGSLRDAIDMYIGDDEHLEHGFEGVESLFPDYQDVRPGAPELIQRDAGWVNVVMGKTHKSPFARIRTRQTDIRDVGIRAAGHTKGDKKKVAKDAKVVKRTTDPQTVYRKDALHRDDLLDITDFDAAAYQYEIMKQNLHEDIALAIMIGDGRDDGDDDKISQDHIRSIWHDDDLYTIHKTIDLAAAKKEIQGTNTSMNFSDNYVYAEAIIMSALYARESYKGSGTPDFFCSQHLLNVMLLAKDMNGRRIYNNKADLAAALNVKEIYTAEQFEGQIRTLSDNTQKKLLGIFVNLADYNVGAVKGGEITSINQFDIDFNQEKYLIETRISGALTRAYAAIALEEDVKVVAAG